MTTPTDIINKEINTVTTKQTWKKNHGNKQPSDQTKTISVNPVYKFSNVTLTTNSLHFITTNRTQQASNIAFTLTN